MAATVPATFLVWLPFRDSFDRRPQYLPPASVQVLLFIFNTKCEGLVTKEPTTPQRGALALCEPVFFWATQTRWLD